MRFTGSLLIAAAILAAPPAFPSDTAFSRAREAFVRAVDGDGTAVEEAVRRFEHLAATNTAAAPLYQAYLGAAQTMQGRDAWLPWNKMRATERGLSTIDKALRRLGPGYDDTLPGAAAIALETRLVAITTFLAVPSLFNRFDAGKALLHQTLAHPGYAMAPAELRARLHIQAARVAERDGKRSDEAAHSGKAAALTHFPHADETTRARVQEPES